MGHSRGGDLVTGRALWGRVLYGLLFIVALPGLLLLWARAIEPGFPLPPIHDPPAGFALVILGVLLMIAGGSGLVRHGKGLPMNAFPPPLLVRRGIYRWLRNPMYIGFTLAVLGVSLATGSAAGLWILTPVTGLAALALVWGYERHDLVARFGDAALTPPLLSLPRDREGPATWHERAAVYLWVFIPWLIVYLSVQALGRAPDAFGTTLPFERGWPVWQWTEALYFSTYLVVPLTPLVVRSARGLHRFARQGAIATGIIGLIWIVVPVVAENRPFTAHGVWGALLAFEQGSSHGVAAWPAFHVLWCLLAAEAWSSNRATGGAWWRPVAWSWAWLITLSCLTTGMHTVIEVATAVLCYLPLRHLERTWERIRGSTEAVANSWHEWRFGPIRIINHGLWAAAGSGVGVVIAGCAAGPDRWWAIVAIAVAVLLGAGAWAQALEGSSTLLRPFGWYGGVAGGVIGALLVGWRTDIPMVALLAALSVAAPWIQLLGRMRCLIQGCCHGGPVEARVGIRYRHRRSRVTHLADLAGIPLHATPLYSIAGNLVIGVLMLRLRMLGTPDALILGGYLLLAGIARFVEESYRAEPQTPIMGGLRIYQWSAIVSVAAGIGCTTLLSESPPRTFSAPSAPLLWPALAVALLYGAAMGLDFPNSNRRFSRLAAAD